jgi:hypothetical protein
MNPLLGQNLGRWAQVYFTNPPEKRELAVTALLRELERQTPETMASHKFGAEKPADEARVHEIVCPRCRHRNEVTQRFCGFCGSFLRTDLTTSAQNEPKNRTPRQTPPQTQEVPLDGALREIQWLRDKALESAVQPRPETYRSWKLWKSKFWILGPVLFVVIFAYLEGTSVRRASSKDHPSSQPGRALVSPIQTTQASSRAEYRGDEGVVSDPATASVTHSAGGADQPGAAANGTEELRLAQRHLSGIGGTRDSTEAAQWLWKAVAKHNTNAILLLADLYLRGDGVPKSCDQARLLLVAAAAKGAAEADQKLNGFDSNGCR